MATITSTQTGSFATGSTWVGGVAPTIGDDAVIANTHVVTVDSAVTVGADGVTGTAAITVQTGGELDTTSTLNLRGDLQQQRSSTVELQTGTVLTFEPLAGAQYGWYQIAGGTGNAQMTATGISGSKVIIQTGARGGTGGFISKGTATLYSRIDFTHVKMVGLGSATLNALNYYPQAAGAGLTFTNVVAVGCGDIFFTFRTYDTVVDRLDIIDPLNTAIKFGDNVAKGAEVRSVTNLTIYSTTLVIPTLGGRGVTRSNWVMYNTRITPTNSTLDNTDTNFFGIQDVVGNGFVAYKAKSTSTLTDSVFLSNQTNPHYVSENVVFTDQDPNVFSNNVFDGDANTTGDPGDCFLPDDICTIENNIAINKAGTLITALNLGVQAYVNNNTSHDSYGIALGETFGDATQLRELKNNVFSDQDNGIHQIAAFVPQSSLIVRTNAYNGMDAGNILHPTNNDRSEFAPESVDTWFSAGSYGDADKGATDISADPKFVDATRTVRGYFGLGTVQLVAREMVTINGTDYQGNEITATTETVDNVLTYIRAGFTPTNKALQGTGDGGVDIGAVTVIPAISGSPAMSFYQMLDIIK